MSVEYVDVVNKIAYIVNSDSNTYYVSLKNSYAYCKVSDSALVYFIFRPGCGSVFINNYNSLDSSHYDLSMYSDSDFQNVYYDSSNSFVSATTKQGDLISLFGGDASSLRTMFINKGGTSTNKTFSSTPLYTNRVGIPIEPIITVGGECTLSSSSIKFVFHKAVYNYI